MDDANGDRLNLWLVVLLVAAIVLLAAATFVIV